MRMVRRFLAPMTMTVNLIKNLKKVGKSRFSLLKIEFKRF